MSPRQKTPAFPSLPTYDGEGYPEQSAEGMDLRDYFAGQALPALMAYAFASPEKFAADETGNIGPEVCKAAYATADAMMAERSKS